MYMSSIFIHGCAKRIIASIKLAQPKYCDYIIFYSYTQAFCLKCNFRSWITHAVFFSSFGLFLPPFQQFARSTSFFMQSLSELSESLSELPQFWRLSSCKTAHNHNHSPQHHLLKLPFPCVYKYSDKVISYLKLLFI